MIMPKKHISLSESIFGLSAIVLTHITDDYDIDSIFISTKKDVRTPISTDLDSLILCLDFLFGLGLININGNGGIVKCN